MVVLDCIVYIFIYYCSLDTMGMCQLKELKWAFKAVDLSLAF
jgi:hypothetical protein